MVYRVYARQRLVVAVVINAIEELERRGLEFQEEGLSSARERSAGLWTAEAEGRAGQVRGPAKARKHLACLGICLEPIPLGPL